MSNITFSSQDVSGMVDQLSTRLSLHNIVVPKINTFDDVFDWLNEFDMVTATLPEDQKLKLVVKAFPPGKLLAWYERELKPLISKESTWKTIKNKILSRYSDIEDRDRHFIRMNEMKFNPNGQQKLFDFVEDLLYSFSRALPNEDNDESKIKFVKSRLPPEIRLNLIIINDYSFATSLASFMRGVRQYDSLKSGTSTQSSNKGERVDESKLCSLLQKLIENSEKERESNRNVIAALQARPRDPSPHRNRDNRTPDAPQYNSSHQPSNTNNFHTNRGRSVSPYRGQARPPSPRLPQQRVDPNSRNYYPNYQQHPQSDYYHQNAQNYQNSSAAYDNSRSRPISPRSPSQQRPQNMNRMEPNQFSQTGSSNYNQGNSQPQTGAGNASGELVLLSLDDYLRIKGPPPGPCRCGKLHWYQHCPNYLKE